MTADRARLRYRTLLAGDHGLDLEAVGGAGDRNHAEAGMKLFIKNDSVSGNERAGSIAGAKEATPADIATWLHEHPAEAVDVVRGLKVAGPWQEVSHLHYVRRDPRTSWPAATVQRRHGTVNLYWWLHDDTANQRVEKEFYDPAVAQVAADKALRAAGWSLA